MDILKNIWLLLGGGVTFGAIATILINRFLGRELNSVVLSATQHKAFMQIHEDALGELTRITGLFLEQKKETESLRGEISSLRVEVKDLKKEIQDHEYINKENGLNLIRWEESDRKKDLMLKEQLNVISELQIENEKLKNGKNKN